MTDHKDLPALLAEWTRVHEAATPGEWMFQAERVSKPNGIWCRGSSITDDYQYYPSAPCPDDMRAIAHYHNTYGALLDVVRAVEAQRRASFRIASDKADHPEVREVHEWVHSMMSDILAPLSHLTRAAREADGGGE